MDNATTGQARRRSVARSVSRSSWNCSRPTDLTTTATISVVVRWWRSVFSSHLWMDKGACKGQDACAAREAGRGGGNTPPHRIRTDGHCSTLYCSRGGTWNCWSEGENMYKSTNSKISDILSFGICILSSIALNLSSTQQDCYCWLAAGIQGPLVSVVWPAAGGLGAVTYTGTPEQWLVSQSGHLVRALVYQHYSYNSINVL